MCSALGTAAGTLFDDFQGFQLVTNFVVLPMFFLSGALFPLTDAPKTLRLLAGVDPLSYGVDGLRYSLAAVSHFSLAVDYAVPMLSLQRFSCTRRVFILQDPTVNISSPNFQGSLDKKERKMNIDDIKKIGVLGGGVMGRGISQCAILAGYNVICRDLTDELAAKANHAILNGRFGLASGVKRGKLTQEQVDRALTLLTTTSKVEDLQDVDILIEAIGGSDGGALENKDLKLKVFGEMDKRVKREAIFASNTSYFTIADLAATTTRSDRFVGMHFFSPASIMKGCEIIWTADVLPEVIDIAMELGRRLGKLSVKVKDVPGDTGFVGNRIYRALRQEAIKIVREGVATAEDVDNVMMTGFNWPAGPLGMGRGARGGWK